MIADPDYMQLLQKYADDVNDAQVFGLAQTSAEKKWAADREEQERKRAVDREQEERKLAADREEERRRRLLPANLALSRPKFQLDCAAAILSAKADARRSATIVIVNTRFISTARFSELFSRHLDMAKIDMPWKWRLFDTFVRQQFASAAERHTIPDSEFPVVSVRKDDFAVRISHRGQALVFALLADSSLEKTLASVSPVSDPHMLLFVVDWDNIQLRRERKDTERSSDQQDLELKLLDDAGEGDYEGSLSAVINEIKATCDFVSQQISLVHSTRNRNHRRVQPRAAAGTT